MMFHTKKSHTKSRTGCYECKARRCNEEQPCCGACRRRGSRCVYPEGSKDRAGPRGHRLTDAGAGPEDHVHGIANAHAHANPSTSLELTSVSTCTGPSHSMLIGHTPESTYNARELLNLRLLHHFTTLTAASFASAAKLGDRAVKTLQVDVPHLAFQHPFLMDTLLAVASIHMGSTEPSSLHSLPVSAYRDQALRTLRQAVVNVSDENRRAVIVASLLLASTSFAADRITGHGGLWVANWLGMTMGPHIFVSSAKATGVWDNPYGAPAAVYSLGHFEDHPAPAAIPLDLEALLRLSDLEEGGGDDTHQAVLYEAAIGVGKLIGTLTMPEDQSWLQVKVKAWPLTIQTSLFLQLVRDENPRALIILGYFLVLLRYLPDVWLYEGTAIQDMCKLEKMLAPQWRRFLELPKAALQMEESSRTAYLIGQLPAEALTHEPSFQPFFCNSSLDLV